MVVCLVACVCVCARADDMCVRVFLYFMYVIVAVKGRENAGA